MSPQAGIREFRTGAIVGAPVILAALLYALLTPHGPHRPAILGVVAAGTVALIAVLLGPLRRRIERSGADATMMAWCASFVALATTACILDAGLRSPFVGVFFISVTYAAVTLPTRRVIAIAGLDLLAVIVVGATGDLDTSADFATLGMWVSALGAAAAIGALVSDDRSRRAQALRRSQHEIVHRLALVVESRDNDTGGHVDRMSRYAELIAAELGWHPERCRELRLAAALHDVGKVAVPDAILLKPGRLTAEERSIMEQHCAAGHEMLSGSDSSLLDLAAVIALTHHERWDGAGYPRRLAADQIPLAGRIVAVADVFDALTSRRVYKPAMDASEALQVIRLGRGSQFDAEIVDAFLRRVEDVLVLHDEQRGEDLRHVPAEATALAAVGA